jgi:hypothetical protein
MRPIARGFLVGLLLGIPLLLIPGIGASVIRSVGRVFSLSNYVSFAHASGASDYRLALLGVNGSTIYSVVAVVGSLLLFGFFLGIVQTGANKLGLDQGAVVLVAVCLALIGLAGSQGKLAHVAALMYGLAFGIIGTFLGAAGAGRAVAEGWTPGTILGALALVDAIVFVIVPHSGEVQLILALLLVFNAILSFRALRESVADQGPIFEVLVSPPLILFSVMSAVLVLPVLVPGWSYYQLGIMALGALLGPALER